MSLDTMYQCCLLILSYFNCYLTMKNCFYNSTFILSQFLISTYCTVLAISNCYLVQEIPLKYDFSWVLPYPSVWKDLIRSCTSVDNYS